MRTPEATANERKRAIDELASELLKPNKKKIEEETVTPIATYLAHAYMCYWRFWCG
jgi:hypothetical protein